MKQTLSIFNGKFRTPLLHVIIWFVYIVFIYFTNRMTRPNVTIFGTLLYFVPFAITFYISLYCLNLYKEKGIWWSVASFFIVFLVMATFGYVYIYLIMPAMGKIIYTSTNLSAFLQEALWGYVRFFSFALLYFYVTQTFRKERENAALKQQELKAQQEKLQYEYAFIRSQINPHFLHNTSNTLFSEALNYSPELADNILKLSSIMRYSMEALEFDSGKVSVQKELEHLQTLIDINNLRFGESKLISYEVEGLLNGQMVPPLSFITIVENAFKYGDLKDPLQPLTIRVRLKPGEVHFYCCNKIKKNNMQFSSSNIGITNLSKRLDVAFKNRYEMNAKSSNGLYIFELTVK